MTKIKSSALWRRLLLPLTLIVWSATLGSSPLCAQNIQHTENKPDLALRSDTRVDPSTLGMSVSIPLASYPGRAGHGLPVALTYQSKVLRLEFQGVDYTPITGAKTWTGVKFGEHSTAGWTSTLDPPRVEFTGMGQYYDGQGHAACPDVCFPGQNTVGDHYVKRIHVYMPDGSSHELRLDDQIYLFPVEAFTGTFQAVDGSRMRFESNAGAASVLYLPDGSRYLFGPYNIGNELTATQFIDRNGNTLSYNAGTRQWSDTLGRIIANPLPTNPAANTETYFLAKLVGGLDATYTLRWKYLADVLTPDPATGQPPPLRYSGDYKCAHNSYQNVSPSLFTSSFDTRVCVEQDQFGNPVLFNPVVLAEVVLPTGKFYRFTYTVYGEIDKILLTTGATDRFTYNQVATLSSSTGPYSQTNRGVIERRVSATGTGTDESLWTYAVISTNPYTVRTTRPDLSYSERLLHRSRYTGVGEDFARFEFDDARMGMAYEERSYNSSGVLLRRELSKWIEGGTAGGAARDPKVIKQVSIILDGVGSNALTATTVNRYEQASQPLNLTSTTEYGYDNSMSKTTAQTAGVDTFNPTDSLAIRTTETAYLDNADYNARNLVSLPISVTTRTGMPVSGQVTSRSEMIYDELTPLLCGATVGWTDIGTAPRANVTKVKSWLSTLGAVTNPNAYLATQTQYDQCGSVRKIWDARDTTLSNPTQIEYSHQFAYPTLNTSADPDGAGPLLPLTTATEYDVDTGMVTATVDANGQRTTFSYNDPLNRLRQVVRAATDAVAKNQTTYSYDDTARTITATSDLNSYGDNLLKTVTLYDGLGRATETRTFEGGTNYIAVQQQYDTSGRIFKTSNPFRPWQSETPVWTTTTYDALSRVLTVTTPDNAVATTNYSGNTVTITDQAQKQRKSVTDALGRLIEVYEDPLGVNYQTSYSYDVLDNLTTVTQDTQTRTFIYDSLKRLTSANNPESGTVNYQYDNNGNLLVKTDARGVSAHYEYDGLNRAMRRWYNGSSSLSELAHNLPALPAGVGASDEVKYFYDTQNIPGAPTFDRGYAIGRLVATTYGGGAGTYFGYDATGKAMRSIQHTGSVNYETTAVYNLAGAMTSMVYPSGHMITNTFDEAGRLIAFNGNLGNGTQWTYASEISYSSFGGITQEQFGTSIPLFHKLHYNVRGQLYDIRVSTLSLTQDEFNWNRGCVAMYYGGAAWGQSSTTNNGNVTMQQHWTPLNETSSDYSYTQQSYSYDSLNRLGSVSELHGGPVGQSGTDYMQAYNYDRFGNRTINNGVTWGVPNPVFGVDTNTNRLTAPTGYSMQFDQAGNLTFDNYTGQGTRTYDTENRMKQAWSNNQWQTYVYDGDGRRIKRIVNGTETWQVYGLGGELIGEYAPGASPTTPQKEYGYRNGQLLITAEPTAPATPSGPNFASASYGAIATASSTYSTVTPTNANNGDHVGTGSWWADDTSNTYPDWLQVEFAGSKTIGEIDVYGLQQNYSTPVEPTLTMTSPYALTNFDVQYWTGSAWATVPGGSVIGNDKVWRKFTFAPLTTSKIRVYVTNVAGDNHSQVVELEAYTGSSSASIQWLVPDHLGTPRMIVDQSGGLSNVKRHDYLPFGEELFAGTGGRTIAQGYASGDGVRQQFTSKERDTETGLDYFGARYYGGTQGRFTSPDPLYYTASRPNDPQQFNLYSYLRNSPLALIDPDGRDGYLVANSQAAMDNAKKRINQMAPGTKIDANGKIHKPGFFRRLLNHLTGHGAGTSLISRIADSKNVTLIRATEKGTGPAGIPSSRMTAGFQQVSGCAAVRCDYYIEFGINFKGTSHDRMPDGSIGQGPVDLTVALGHELVHADISIISATPLLREGTLLYTRTRTKGERL